MSAERTYVVEGMTCGHCELAVREEVEGLAGAESAQADRATGRLVVRGNVSASEVRAAVETAGYTLAATAGGSTKGTARGPA